MRDEESIFAEALQKQSSEEREALLRAACGDDARMRRNIEKLLHAHQQVNGILDYPPSDFDATQSHSTQACDLSGLLIGPYKLLERVGEGGMGAVYMAEQQRPVRRKVALKIVKPGMDTRQVIARFEAERQALAIMDHPNIARVLDGGVTDSGVPYFVMELVKGVPLTAYCDQNCLSLRERLELFVQICQAVQHAHQKGIIHRDLKPSNVLVTLRDGTAVPKIIDFGIAKAISGERLTEQTLFTNYAQLVGTPLYMSPEQAGLSSLDVDTRTDIYSLGVMLYELLTGTTPFDRERLGNAAHEEIRRIVREEEPPKPSTRLSTLGEALRAVSTTRAIAPARLGQLVRGELDWIVMKALEKDRKLRYETTNGLARDVERYLKNEPVEACPPSRGYRLRKFVRRNRLAAGVALALVLVLASFGGLVTYGAIRERNKDGSHIKDLEAERNRTLAEKAAVEDARESLIATNRFLLKMIAAPDQGETNPKRSGSIRRTDMTVQQVLMEAARLLNEGSLAKQPKAEIAVRYTLSTTFEGLGLYPEAEEQSRVALKISTQTFGERSVSTASCAQNLGLLLRRKGENISAFELLRRSLELYRELLDKDDRRIADSLMNLGSVLIDTSDFTGAEKCVGEARERFRKLGGDADPGVTLSIMHLALIALRKNDFTAAQTLYSEALKRRVQELGPTHVVVAALHADLAYVLRQKSDLTSAEQHFLEALRIQRELLDERHPSVLKTVGNLYTVLLMEKQDAAAQKLQRESQLRYALAEEDELYRDLGHMELAKFGCQSVSTLEGKVSIALSQLDTAARLARVQKTKEELRQSLEYRMAQATPTTRPSNDKMIEAEIKWLHETIAGCEVVMGELQEAAGPFGRNPVVLPNLIQAEDFDRGGFGVSYWDSTPEAHGHNQQYRKTAVDLDNCSDEGGGLNVCGIVPGEWLTYTVEVARDGEYDIDLRISTIGPGAKVHFLFSGVDTGPAVLPDTKGWDRWTTVTRPKVLLHKGRQIMRVAFVASDTTSQAYVCNLNWIRVRKVGG